jgi:uncharacterized membrane protein (DUF2068 family)
MEALRSGEQEGEAMESGSGMEEIGTANEQITDTPHDHVSKHHGHRHHDSGLLLIGLFKLVEAVFFFLVGVGALHFLHRDLGDAVLRLAVHLRRDPEGRLVGFVLDHVDELTAHRLKQIGVATFCYGALRVTEGVGLVLEKVWAEYLTVGVTVSFLPWEMYEIVMHLDWFRVGLFLVNLAVLAYLVWWLRRKKPETVD